MRWPEPAAGAGDSRARPGSAFLPERFSRMRSLLIAGVLAACLALPAAARDYTLGELVISQPWVRATAAAGGTGGGYLVVRNRGSLPDRLVRVESPAAASIELHGTRMEGSVMQMHPVEGVAVPAGGEARLAPGGLHIMFLNTTRRFVQGEHVAARLVFERAGAIEVEFAVEAPGARGPGHGH